MQRRLILVLLSVLAACAPTQQASYDFLVSPADSSYFQTMTSSFYGELGSLGVRVDSFETFSYTGQDKNVPEYLLESLTTEGFCTVRGGVFTSEYRPHVLVVAADGDLGVKGVVYDLSRSPQVTYAYFQGESTRALPTARCG